jgi:hypothetical protein
MIVRRRSSGAIDPMSRKSPSINSAAMAVPSFEPLAVALDQAAELLDKPIEQIQAAAAQVEPYQHHDGSPRWSLYELRIALGLPVKKRYRRSKGGTW